MKLRPHEQSIPTYVTNLAEQIRRDGMIIHPVVVDASSGLVVDGTHRVEAVARLGIPLIPVYAVDYFSPDVELRSWGRAASTTISPEVLETMYHALGFRLSTEDEPYAMNFLWNDGYSRKVTVDEVNLSNVYEKIYMMEKSLQPLGITYVREQDLEQFILSSRNPFGYNIRPLHKHEVYDSVLSGYRLPPKSTRHLVRRRPMFLFCPTEILHRKDAEDVFHEWLAGGVWVEIPAGVVLDRRYDEETLVFYRDDLRHLYPSKLLNLLKTKK
ncbi:MAG: ParB N-terminal domain-containing protein [Candidatus Caldarchaeum sp.]|nr:ParB N-terminal domain-containing protein [Candidatus Caldarchaeum sp.]